MSSRLVTCRGCRRHVFAKDPSCPFCGARILASAVVAFAASLSLIACDRDAKTATSPPAELVEAAAPPPPSASAAASADAGEPDPSGLGMGGELKIGSGGGLDAGSLGWLRQSTGVYGPAQPSGLAGVAGPQAQVQLSAAKSTVPIADLDRVLAGSRARLRAICQSGVRTDPALDGSADLTLTIEPDGSVSSAVVKHTKLTPTIAAGMERVFKGLQFSTPAKQATVTGKVTCKAI